jgi:GGDEF domain-containing protein
LRACSRPWSVRSPSESRSIALSASIGVSVCPLNGEEPDVLLRNADQAMLIAKQSGRSRCSLFDTELEGRALCTRPPPMSKGPRGR